MGKHRVHRKLARSDEEIAREKEVQKTFQAQRPTLNDLLATGDYTEPMTQQEYWNIEKVAHRLKSLRESQGLSLSDVSARTGMDRAAISRLENGVHGNPTVQTLSRYARAIGKRIVVQILDASTDDLDNPRDAPATS